MLPTGDGPPANLIFLHIGKTGGVSFGKVIGRMFAGRTINRFDEPTDSALGLRRTDHVRKVIFDALDQTPQPRLIVGHIPFGAHVGLVSHGYITLVREPRDRVISSYYYLKGIKTLPISAVLERLSLAEYATAHYGLDPHDYQTRILSGDPSLDAPLTGEEIDRYRDLTEADYAQAIANIDEHFLFVGLTDRLGDALLLLRRLYGWKFVDLLAGRENVGTNRPERSSIPQSTLDVIDGQNVFDHRLYRECAARFDRLVRAQGWRFRQEARLFRVATGLAGGGPLARRMAGLMCALLDRLQSPASSPNRLVLP